jgi:hypothetical protein
MALLRWIHMRKLVPLTELLGGVQSASEPRPVAAAPKRAEPSVRKAAPVVPPVERRAPVSEPKAYSPQPKAQSPEPKAKELEPHAGRDAFLLEIRKSKIMFYNTVVAQAQKIEFGPERVTFSFLPAHRLLREQVEQNRAWLEQTASQADGASDSGIRMTEPAAAMTPDLKTSAMSDTAVQAMLDVFPAEIENVEEIE